METPLVSVIVPIYNIEKYLCECIDSILNQTYSHLEIILVDDGSTDASPQICDDYQAKDKRVKVIHKKNGGLSSAREAGVNESNGQYIMFVDGDDWLELNAVEICMDEIKKDSNIGCVIFTYSKETPNRTINVEILESSVHFIGNDAKEKIYRKFFGPIGKELLHPEKMENISTCWGKLYKRNFLLQGKYFDTKKVGFCEDVLFNIFALDGCTDIVYLNEQLYHYRKIPISLSRTYRPNFVEQSSHLFSIMEQVIKEKNLNQVYKEALYNRIAISMTVIGLNESRNTSNGIIGHIKATKSYLKNEKYRNAISNIKIRDFTFIWKLFLICCRIKFATPVYCAIMLIQKMRNKI